MNADDITVGMELEAMERVAPGLRGRGTEPTHGSRWLPAKVRRRLDPSPPPNPDSLRGLFEVEGGELGLANRYADELRSVQAAGSGPWRGQGNAVAGARGGSVVVWWTPGAVSVEVRGASAADSRDGVRVLVPIARAGDMAAALRAGAYFHWSCALFGRHSAALLAGLVESAATGTRPQDTDIDRDPGQKPADPLAGARGRTDDNLRRAFGC